MSETRFYKVFEVQESKLNLNCVCTLSYVFQINAIQRKEISTETISVVVEVNICGKAVVSMSLISRRVECLVYSLWCKPKVFTIQTLAIL